MTPTDQPSEHKTLARPPIQPGLALMVAILAVSSASILIRFAQEQAPSLVIAALRIGIASVVLLPVVLLRYMAELQRLTRSRLLLALLSGIFLAVHFATWISSLEYTTVASSVVFVSTGPLWVALASPLLLKERVSREALFGLAIALLGGLVVGLSDACTSNGDLDCSGFLPALRGNAMWGNFLALAGAWAVAGYLIIGRRLRERMSLIPYIFIVYGMATVVLTGFAVTLGQSFGGYPTLTYGWIVLLALVPQLIGHSTYNWALKYMPASTVATANLGEPIGSAILAYLILQENPGLMTLLGGVLILAGIYLASRQPNPAPEGN